MLFRRLGKCVTAAGTLKFWGTMALVRLFDIKGSAQAT